MVRLSSSMLIFFHYIFYFGHVLMITEADLLEKNILVTHILLYLVEFFLDLWILSWFSVSWLSCSAFVELLYTEWEVCLYVSYIDCVHLFLWFFSERTILMTWKSFHTQFCLLNHAASWIWSYESNKSEVELIGWFRFFSLPSNYVQTCLVC